MPKLKDKITFVPAGFIDFYGSERFWGQKAAAVTGRICEIHWRHRWYRVRYCVNGRTMYECFKF